MYKKLTYKNRLNGCHTCTGAVKCLMQICSKAAGDQPRPTWTRTPPARAPSGWCASSSRCEAAKRTRPAPGRSAGWRRCLNQGQETVNIPAWSLYVVLYLAAQGYRRLLYLSGQRFRSSVRKKGNESQKLCQETCEEQNQGEPLLLSLRR